MYPSWSTLKWLTASLGLGVLPHLFHVTQWVTPAFLILLGWRYLITRHQWQLPNRWLQLAIAMLILTSIMLSYRTVFGREAGVALLIALSGLKLLEMNSLRDALLICFLSYFIIITNFLYSQTIPLTLYLGVVLWITTTTLITLSDVSNHLSWQQRLQLATTLLLQAIPLMIALFILFPRISGTFLGLPKDVIHSGMTGLDDSMSPSTISELILSDEIVFRVKFAKDIPPPAQRYWRGPVLWWSNGQEWKARFTQEDLPQPVNLNPLGNPFDYTITLEPHQKRWMFALDLPMQVPPQATMTLDYQILATLPIYQRIRYDLTSYPRYRATLITPQLYNLALRLPKGKHPRTIALAKQWQQELIQPATIIQRALQYFNQQAFFYTYTPPLTLDDPIDEFLFESRQGFCGHYAAAFTVLMRAAGLPTRIVTGYLGGTLNPIGNYLVVRQRDAHAWTEVWLSDQGWVRVDPTGAIAPERIEKATLPLEMAPFLGIELSNDSPLVQGWQSVKNSWDALNNAWNQWVLGYDRNRQKQFLTGLGWENLDWPEMTTVLVMVLGTFLGIMAAWMFLRPLSWPDPVQKTYLRFCKKLTKQGFHRRPHEGPLDFAARVKAARPDLVKPVQQITELYVKIRYSNQPQAVADFKRAVQLLRAFPKP